MLDKWADIINKGGAVRFYTDSISAWASVGADTIYPIPWPDLEDFLPGGLYSILRTVARHWAPNQYRILDPPASARATVRFPNLLLAGYEVTISGETLIQISLDLQPPPPSVAIIIERPSDKIAYRMQLPVEKLAANMTRDALVFEIIKAITQMTAATLSRPLADSYEAYGIEVEKKPIIALRGTS